MRKTKAEVALFCKRLLVCIVGLVLVCLAGAVNYLIELGSDPYQVFMSGLHNVLGISYGNANLLMNGVITAMLLLFFRKYIKVALLLTTFFNGVILDGWMALLAPVVNAQLPMAARVALMLASCLLMALGTFIYLMAQLGGSPADSVGLVISERTHVPYRKIRWLTDGSFFLLGAVLGGQIGVNTVVLALCTGPLIGQWERLYGWARLLRQRRREKLAALAQPARPRRAG